MELEYNLLNIIMLFGAIQGFILCVFIYKKNVANKLSVRFFLLFLFSLAFYNLIYALLDLNVFKYYRPLHVFPFPYKWLIGAGFYFYIKNQFPSKEGLVFHKKEWYLLAPAMVYGLLRTYWFAIAAKENSYRIIKVLVDSDFFRIHEFFYQFFTIFLLVASLQVIKSHEPVFAQKQKAKSVLQWLKRLTLVFLAIMLIDLVLYTTDLLLHNWKETFLFSYPTLILNTAFIYWIGYMGFSQPKLFFNIFSPQKQATLTSHQSLISQKIKDALDKELYTNPHLTLGQFAAEIDTSPKELSKHINEVHQMNFSEFLSLHRVEKVKQLLASPDAQKFTFVTLAKDAGFSSKSSFNSSFKKITGMTPSAYKKQHTAP